MIKTEKRKVLKAQLISDLHLEFPDIFENIDNLVPTLGDVLLCAGDIGNYRVDNLEKFLAIVSERFEKVFYVAGNHEFYRNEYYFTIEKINNICDQFDNVHFLNKTSVVYKNIRFCGITLWSDVPQKKRKFISTIYNDYRFISIKDNKNEGKERIITVDDTVKIHREEISWLISEIEKCKEVNIKKLEHEKQKIVVISHHCPIFKKTTILPTERGYGTIFGSGTNCSFLFEDIIDTWAYGHTHFSTTHIVKGVRVISNQIGYASQKKKTLYNKELVFEIPRSKGQIEKDNRSTMNTFQKIGYFFKNIFKKMFSDDSNEQNNVDKNRI